MGKQIPQRQIKKRKKYWPTSTAACLPAVNLMEIYHNQKRAKFNIHSQNQKIEESEVRKLLLGINPSKSPGLDGLHPKALKELTNVITEPLTIIFNVSKDTGIVPNIWKLGNIVALFKKKKEPKTDPGNYRPVSLTSIICKLMEKLVKNQIVSHMTKNKLFSKKQFGFISGRSTTLQLLKVMNEWTEILDNGCSIDSVYMDFMKAFES